jgi:hypothetical protein
MTRIRITGRRSFQPTLEGLENRDVADAGFGRALLSNLVAPPAAAHVRQFNLPAAAPQGNADLNKEILAAGRKFGEQVVQQFVQRNFQFSDVDFKNVGELKGSVYLNERIDNVHQPDHGGLWVGVFLERRADYVHDDSIHVTLRCDLNFRFKYEGRVDGVDQFSLSHFRSSDFSRWKSDLDGGLHKRKEISPSAYFGVVNVALKKEFGTFSAKAGTSETLAAPQAALDQVFTAMSSQGLPLRQAGVATAPQGGVSRTIGDVAVDQLRAALKGKQLQDRKVIAFALRSVQPEGGDIKVEVHVELAPDRYGRPCSQRLSFTLTPSLPDSWTVKTLSQGQGSIQFDAQSLAALRGAVNDIHFPGGAAG